MIPAAPEENDLPPEMLRLLARELTGLPDAHDLRILARRLPVLEQQAELLRALPLEDEEPLAYPALEPQP